MTPLKFAVLGHPNEGKSSVVSTLTENDRIPVSRTPGETTVTQATTIRLDGKPALEILDTPGFQNPAATLEWFQGWSGPETEMLDAFIQEHAENPSFHHDCELLGPLRKGTAILYVIDPSRPLREVDRQEMELLRLTGLPRMALLNEKRERDHEPYRAEWEEALKRRFNLIRPFNAHRATFAERIDLFSALAVLNPEEESTLRNVRDALITDWTERITESIWILEDLLSRADRFHIRLKLDPAKPEAAQREQALQDYQNGLRKLEQRARADWRKRFRHRDLPSSSETLPLAEEDLFAEKVWKVLGLTRWQMTGAAATAGAMIGAGVDVAAGGITFGVFSAGAAVAAGVGSWLGAPKLGAKSHPFRKRKRLSQEEFRVGPASDPTLVFVLLDRSLLYLHQVMNWSHGRRNPEAFLASVRENRTLSRTWSDQDRKGVMQWRKHHQKSWTDAADKSAKRFRDLLYIHLSTPTEDPS